MSQRDDVLIQHGRIATLQRVADIAGGYTVETDRLDGSVCVTVQGAACSVPRNDARVGTSSLQAVLDALEAAIGHALACARVQSPEPHTPPEPHPFDIAAKLPGELRCYANPGHYSAAWIVGAEDRAIGSGDTPEAALRDLLSIQAVKAALPKDD